MLKRAARKSLTWKKKLKTHEQGRFNGSVSRILVHDACTTYIVLSTKIIAKNWTYVISAGGKATITSLPIVSSRVSNIVFLHERG